MFGCTQVEAEPRTLGFGLYSRKLHLMAQRYCRRLQVAVMLLEQQLIQARRRYLTSLFMFR